MRISDWSSDVCSSDLFASLLLLSTALVAPPALAQDSDALAADSPAAPQDEEQGDVSIPGGVDQEIVVNGRFTPNAVRATTEVVSVLSSADSARTGEGEISGALPRVTGISAAGGGVAYVWGPGDRDSHALLK